MKKYASRFLYVLALAGLMFVSAPKATAQADGDNDADDHFNPKPCDFNDTFYQENGIDVNKLNQSVAGRFGNFRQFGPPSRSSTQANWVADEDNCFEKDPTRRDIRILATTGGYIDDGTGSPTEFISLIAFLTDQTFFLQNFSKTVGGSTISIASGKNPRGIAMQDIVGNFEAYAALRQRLSNGTFALTPCGTMGTGATPCFPVSSVATPHLRQDWRFATNRNVMDGSDGNCINTDTAVCASINDAPFGYFCDDLLGMWIITYFWFTVDPANPGPVCGPIFSTLRRKNGASLDGTPIIKTADELNNQLEANGCGAEGKTDVGGADFPAAVWLICPAIPDPRSGAIASDAFLDSVHTSSGAPLDPAFTRNFNCLQQKGNFPDQNGNCNFLPVN